MQQFKIATMCLTTNYYLPQACEDMSNFIIDSYQDVEFSRMAMMFMCISQFRHKPERFDELIEVVLKSYNENAATSSPEALLKVLGRLTGAYDVFPENVIKDFFTPQVMEKLDKFVDGQ